MTGSAQIAAALREQIDDGILKPGDVVSVLELACKWGAAPRPVVQALQAVAGEGRIRLCRGYGYIVQPHHGPPLQAPRCQACGYCFAAIGHKTECA